MSESVGGPGQEGTTLVGITVLPMGWSSAVAIMQCAHRQLALRSEMKMGAGLLEKAEIRKDAIFPALEDPQPGPSTWTIQPSSRKLQRSECSFGRKAGWGAKQAPKGIWVVGYSHKCQQGPWEGSYSRTLGCPDRWWEGIVEGDDKALPGSHELGRVAEEAREFPYHSPADLCGQSGPHLAVQTVSFLRTTGSVCGGVPEPCGGEGQGATVWWNDAVGVSPSGRLYGLEGPDWPSGHRQWRLRDRGEEQPMLPGWAAWG